MDSRLALAGLKALVLLVVMVVVAFVQSAFDVTAKWLHQNTFGRTKKKLIQSIKKIFF